jgi:flagellin-like hook-associated protein FlgL
MSDITLTSTERTTLLSLQQVTSLQNRTQERLNTGKKVNSATDNASSYFQSAALTTRSTEFTGYKSTIDQSIQSINAALQGTSQVETLLNDLLGVVQNARGGSTSQLVSATTQFKNIGQQLAQLVKDTNYQGLNLLTSSSTSLSTQFSNRTAATFSISGYALLGTGSRSIFTAASAAPFSTSTGAVTFSVLINDYGSTSAANSSTSVKGFSQLITSGATSGLTATQVAAIFNGSINAIDNAISQVEAITASLATNVDILNSRSQFSANYANTLINGSNALTLADLNTEAANSTALALRQQLGIQSLSTSSTQNSSILTLLRAS